MNHIIYKAIAACGLFLLLSLPAYSQIGINTETPDASAALDIRTNGANQGMLLPRMTTAQKGDIRFPANSLLVFDTDKDCVSQNLGSDTSPVWTCLTLFNKKFFYMPSINIPTTTLGAASLDLFAIYQSQFGSPMYTSLGAPAAIPQYTNATDLYYYVTYHDSTLITITNITDSGVMNFTKLRKADYDDYINIVFVVK